MKTQGYAIWLYGSHARGNWDHCSDLDIFITAPQTVNIDELQSFIPISFEKASISRYTWDEVLGMAMYGSLFLHHLNLEGYPLYESPLCSGTLKSIFSNLGDYEYAHRDLCGFNTVLDDIDEALKVKGTEIYELSVLATVIRHCSILGCWLLGTPQFGRLKPVQSIVERFQFERGMATEFPNLYKYRLYIDSREEENNLASLQPHIWLNRAKTLVRKLEDIVSG